MNAYCGNNPITNVDPGGTCYVPIYSICGAQIGVKWMTMGSPPGAAYYCNKCSGCDPAVYPNAPKGSSNKNSAIQVSTTDKKEKETFRSWHDQAYGYSGSSTSTTVGGGKNPQLFLNNVVSGNTGIYSESGTIVQIGSFKGEFLLLSNGGFGCKIGTTYENTSSSLGLYTLCNGDTRVEWDAATSDGITGVSAYNGIGFTKNYSQVLGLEVLSTCAAAVLFVAMQGAGVGVPVPG